VLRKKRMSDDHAALQPIAVHGHAFMLLPSQYPVTLVDATEPLYRELPQALPRPKKCQRRRGDAERLPGDERRVNRCLAAEFERCLLH
jgi:hypothetical protein